MSLLSDHESPSSLLNNNKTRFNGSVRCFDSTATAEGPGVFVASLDRYHTGWLGWPQRRNYRSVFGMLVVGFEHPKTLIMG
jgi:hypothetical protein